MRARAGAGMNAPLAVVLGPGGTVLSSDERAFYREADPFGFILFARNIETPEQVRRLTSDLRDAVGRDAIVMIDQEGGRVQRMRPPYWRQWLPPLDQVRASHPGMAARGLWLRYRMIAAELRAAGVDCNCAPTLDIASDETHPFLRNRCLGSDAEEVAANGRAVADALLAGGVLPVMKHMPGHGRARVDSHQSLPHAPGSREELGQTDFAPFRALADLPMAMTAHIVVPAWDDARPATQSPEMIGVIRDVIGFNGLLFSDDLGMEALSGTIPDRACAALAAGCDVVLHCNGTLQEMMATARAARAMTGEAVERANAALARRVAPVSIDGRALLAELGALVQTEDGSAAHG